MAHRLASAVVNAREVGRQDLDPLLFHRLLHARRVARVDRGHSRDPRVVDQDVDPVPDFDHVPDHHFHLILARDVATERDDPVIALVELAAEGLKILGAA